MPSSSLNSGCFSQNCTKGIIKRLGSDKSFLLGWQNLGIKIKGDLLSWTNLFLLTMVFLCNPEIRREIPL